MKTSNILLAIIACFLYQLSISQTCTAPDNIYQGEYTHVFASNNYEYGQSFTAECNGNIRSILVFTTEVTSSFSGSLSIYEEVPFTGIQILTPVYMQSINWETSTSVTTQIIELSPSFSVINGESYTFMIEGTVGKLSYQIDDSIIGDTYSGGSLMSRNPSNNLWVKDGGRDLKFELNYTDVIAPTAICMNATIYLDATGEATLTISDIDNGSNGGVVSQWLDKTDFNCSNLGDNNTVTLSMNDAAFNFASCDATVTVVDNLPPINTFCPQNIVVSNCGLAPVTYDIPSFTSLTSQSFKG